MLCLILATKLTNYVFNHETFASVLSRLKRS